MPSPLGWAVPRPATGFSSDDAPAADRVGSVLIAGRQMPQTGSAQLAGERRDRRRAASATAGVVAWSGDLVGGSW
jgi:hypothetical protein